VRGEMGIWLWKRRTSARRKGADVSVGFVYSPGRAQKKKPSQIRSARA
jgi:hypothetical protein